MKEVIKIQISDYLLEQGLVIIPVLIIIGKIIKSINFIDDKFIPLILLAVGELAAVGLMGLSASSAVQGVLLAGTAVFGNQLFKQLKETE